MSITTITANARTSANLSGRLAGRKKRAQACSLRRDELIDKGAIITGE
jgi:hypothetical protein